MSYVPSIQDSPFEWIMLMYLKNWIEGTYDIPKRSPYFFVTTEPNQVGFFAEMQMIRTSVRILRHIQINLTISKAIDAESLTVIIFGTSVMWVVTFPTHDHSV